MLLVLVNFCLVSIISVIYGCNWRWLFDGAVGV